MRLFLISTICLLLEFGGVSAENEFSAIDSLQAYLEFNKHKYKPVVKIVDEIPSVQITYIHDAVSKSPVYFSPSRSPDKVFREDILIGTYNVLYDGFLFYNQFDRIKGFDWQLIDPKSRQLRVIERIKSLDADVLCLQEVSESLFIKILEMDSRYSGIFMHAHNADPQGVALFVNQEEFEGISLSDIRGKNNENKTHKGTLYLPLSRKGDVVTVACGHLPWYESWTRDEITKEKQREDIVNFFHIDVSKRDENMIYLGDFNTTSEVVKEHLKDKRLDYLSVDVLETAESYNTCFDDYEDGKHLYSIAEKIDHIFYQLPSKYQLVEELSIVTQRHQSNYVERQVILGEIEPSDHLPVLARLHWPVPQSQ